MRAEVQRQPDEVPATAGCHRRHQGDEEACTDRHPEHGSPSSPWVAEVRLSEHRTPGHTHILPAAKPPAERDPLCRQASVRRHPWPVAIKARVGLAGPTPVPKPCTASSGPQRDRALALYALLFVAVMPPGCSLKSRSTNQGGWARCLREFIGFPGSDASRARVSRPGPPVSGPVQMNLIL